MIPCNAFIQLINPFYLLLLIAYGSLMVVFYQLLVNKTKYELDYLLLYVALHLGPLFLFGYFIKSKGNIILTGIFVLIYLEYIKQKNMTLYDIYFSKRQITNLEALKEYMKSHNF